MKIQNINYSYTNFCAKKPKKESFSKNNAEKKEFSSIPQPANIAFLKKKNADLFEKFLAKKGKVTKKEYDEIVKKHPNILIEAYKLIERENPVSSSPKTVAKAAILLKDKYDEEYNGNYIIASIGTSPSPITEVMSALGCDVVFIPASGLNMLVKNDLYIFRKSYPTTASRNPNVRHIVDYALKNGINPKNKNYLILLDYCCSGAGLDNLCNIFIEEGIYRADKMHDHSLLMDLYELSSLNNPNSIYSLQEHANMCHDAQYSDSESISNVPHFHVFDQQNVGKINHISSEGKKQKQLFKEFDEFSRPTARAFSLCAIHEANKMINNIS